METLSKSLSSGVRRYFETNKTAVIEACPLYALPMEIYDAILTYAFPHNAQLKIMYSKDWAAREKEKQRRSPQYVPQIMPALKVDEWLVSKWFFCDAARTWFAAQTFPHLIRCAWTPRPETLPAWSLKCVRIELQPKDFKAADGVRSGWDVHLTEPESESIRVSTGLSRLPAFTSLEIYQVKGREVRWSTRLSDTQKLVLQSNVRKLQDLTRQKAGSKAVIQKSTWLHAPRPMYMRSKVYLNVSHPMITVLPGFRMPRRNLQIIGYILLLVGFGMLLIRAINVIIGKRIILSIEFKVLI
nr:hypothetical protein B0A51_13426 [Rachicladosporium sp. CCFEE 5018]